MTKTSRIAITVSSSVPKRISIVGLWLTALSHSSVEDSSRKVFIALASLSYSVLRFSAIMSFDFIVMMLMCQGWSWGFRKSSWSYPCFPVVPLLLKNDVFGTVCGFLHSALATQSITVAVFDFLAAMLRPFGSLMRFDWIILSFKTSLFRIGFSLFGFARSAMR